eukprot:m.192828 g.192828  ORF g.192828 m.192828 type:complete len:105 (-) comp53669_c1_seq4:3-317(-)
MPSPAMTAVDAVAVVDALPSLHQARAGDPDRLVPRLAVQLMKPGLQALIALLHSTLQALCNQHNREQTSNKNGITHNKTRTLTQTLESSTCTYNSLIRTHKKPT